MSQLITFPPVIRHPFSAMAEIDAVPFHVADPGWQKLWQETAAGAGVKVGIIDTGIDASHPEFKHCLKDARDFTGSRRGAHDVEGHGTHVASLIAGKMCGSAAAADIYIGKGLGDNGGGSDESVVQAGYWLIDTCRVDILSMSLGAPHPSEILEQFCRYAASKCVLAFAASGNEGATRSGFPAGYDAYCQSIGAIDRQMNVARFSNSGVSLDNANYGVQVYGAAAGGGYIAMSGTSMATPIEAALAANILALEKKMFGQRKTKSIADWSRFNVDVLDLESKGRDDRTGYGFHVPTKMVERVLAEARPVVPGDPPPTGDPAGKVRQFRFEGVMEGTFEDLSQ